MKPTLALTAASLLLLATAQANAGAVLSPPSVVVTLGGAAVHLTPRDQDGNVVDITKCIIINVPPTLITMSKDATGMVLTAVGTGTVTLAQWKCTNDATTAASVFFTMSVPWNVTAIGHTSP